MNIARSSLKLAVSRAGSATIGFLIIVYLTRNLDTDILGTFFLFQALLGLISIPVDFGMRRSLSKRLSERSNDGEVITTVILMKIIPLSICLFLVYSLRSQINNYLGADLVTLLISAIVLQEMALFTIGVLNGQLRVGETAVPKFTRRIAFASTTFFLIERGFGVRGAIYGLLIGLSAMLAIALYRVQISFGFPSFSMAASLFEYSKYAFISSVGGYLYNWMDVALLGLFLTQSDVSIYEVSWRVTAIVMLLGQSVATTIFPQVSKWDADGAHERIENLLPQAVAPVLLLVIPAFMGTIVLSQEILSVVFGSEYAVGQLVLIILMGEKVIQSVHIILGTALQGIDRPDLAARAAIIAIFLNLVLNIVLILQYGIVGAAVATGLSFIANSLLHAYYLSQFVNIRLPWQEIGATVVASIGMGSIVFMIKNYHTIDSLQSLLGIVITGMVVYALLAATLAPLRDVIITNLRRMDIVG
ncbi:flippase [Natronoarchaeum mannanilyticum]